MWHTCKLLLLCQSIILCMHICTAGRVLRQLTSCICCHPHAAALAVQSSATGAILAGKAADCMGPRHAQVVNCIAFMLGSLLAGGATTPRLFLLGRFVSGFGEQRALLQAC